MSTVCTQTTLANPGGDCKLKINRIRRAFATLTLDHTGALNTITIANAQTIAAWQTKFDEFNFETNAQQKVVVLPLTFGVETTVNNQSIFDQDTYIAELFKGDTDFTFNLNDVAPHIIKSLQDYEVKNISIWLVDENDGRDKGGIIGKRNGSNFDPFPLSFFSIANWNFPFGDTPSQIAGTLRFADSKDLNDATKVLVSDTNGNVINLTDDKTRVNVWSLVDATLTSSNPAATGTDFTVALDNVYQSDKETNQYLTDSNITYDLITYVKSDGTTFNPAIATLSYDAATYTFTVNDATLALTAGTYTTQIRLSKFDIVSDTFTVV